MIDLDRYARFLLNSSGSLYEFECLEITHPQFPKAFRYVRNDEDGLTVKHEDGLEYAYAYQQLGVSQQTVHNHLDQKLDVTIVDYDDDLIDALDLVTNGQNPKVQLRKYRSDDLNTVLSTSGELEAKKISKDSYGKVTFEASTPSLNDVATGELYTFERFPLLRGTL